MRERTIHQIEKIFNRLEQAKRRFIDRKLADAAYVGRHWPFHEFAARKLVLNISRAQDRLMMGASLTYQDLL